MGRDMNISLVQGKERWHRQGGPAYWLALALGTALLLGLLVTQAVRADNHTATLTDLSLAQTDDDTTAVALSPTPRSRQRGRTRVPPQPSSRRQRGRP